MISKLKLEEWSILVANEMIEQSAQIAYSLQEESNRKLLYIELLLI